MAAILVIEDDANLQSTLVDLLGSQHAPVEAASNAEEAIEKARRIPFHLVITDVRMAGKHDGVSALESIQALQPKIRSIIMTGYADQDVPLRAARLHADDYLLKPFRLHVLLESVRSTLQKESPVPRWLDRVLAAPSEAAQKALRLLYDGHLQHLNRVREQCLQRFFLLVRSQRLIENAAYLGFCRWEQLELEYARDSGPQNWRKLASAYEALADSWLEMGGSPSKTMSPPMFGQLYRKIVGGQVDSLQLAQAIPLLHDAELRRESVQSYCTYHWVWSQSETREDPFLGLNLESYTLKQQRHSSTPQVRLYEAQHTSKPQAGDTVVCLPVNPDSQALVRLEIESDRASLLHTGMGHYFLLYRGHALSLRYRLPPDGLSPREAWQLLRPVFLQVMKYHEEGIYSGHLSLKDVDALPGQPCQLSHFSDRAYKAQHKQMARQRLRITEFSCAPEISLQPEPTAASDQAVLGRMLFEVIFGGNYPDPGTRLHMLYLGQPEANQHFRPFVARLEPLAQVFYRLCHHQPQQRFPNLAEAVKTLDSLVGE